MGVDNQVVTHLVLDVRDSDESFNGDCDLALVCLSEEMIDTLVERLREVATLKKCDTTQTRWGSMCAKEAKRGLPTEESHESLAVGALRDLVKQVNKDSCPCRDMIDLTRAKAVLSGV